MPTQKSFIVSLLAALSLLIVPSVASGADPAPGTYLDSSQYMTPEEYLLSHSLDFSQPTNARDVRANYYQMQAAQKALNQHVTAVPYWQQSSASSSASSEATHAAAPAAPADASSSDGLTPEERRLLARYRAQQLLGIGNEPLHSGAPLTSTGPAGYLTVTVILGSVGWTVRRAKRMEG